MPSAVPANRRPSNVLDTLAAGRGAPELALRKYDVNVIGITLSRNQHRWTTERLANVPTTRSFDVRLQGWKEFDDKVDRIVGYRSIRE